MAHAATLQSMENVENSRAPWSAWSAALISLLAVFVTGGGSAAPVMLAVALMGSRVLPWRVESTTSIQFMRFVFWGGAFAVHYLQQKANVYGHWLLNAYYILAFGELCGAEMVVQAWRLRPSTGSMTRVLVFLSALVFVSACNTFETRYIRILAPPYIFLIALTLLSFRPRPAGNSRKIGRTPYLRATALAIALTIGGGIYFGFWTFRHDLTRMFLEYLQRQHISDATGVASQPFLTSQTSLRGGARRVLKISGPTGEYHLRSAAFDLYAQGHWGPDVDIRHFEPVDGTQFRPDAPGAQLEITRVVDHFRFLVAPLNCAGLQPQKDFAVHNSPENGGPLRTRLWPMAPYTHRVILSDNPRHQGPLCQEISEIGRARCLTVPYEIKNEIAALARRIGGDFSDPFDKIEAVERYLEKNHAYSLETSLAPGDPILSFLRDKKEGHCELFASAAAMLLRSLNVPSRYVTGYYAHEVKDGGNMVVRDRDGHAWTECWIEDLGWVTVDATPASGMPDESGPSIFRRAWESLQDWIAALLASMGDSDWTHLIWVLIGGACFYITFRFLSSLRKLKRPTSDSAGSVYSTLNPELAGLARRFDTLLHARGLACPSHLTWQEHLQKQQSAELMQKDPRSRLLNLSLAETFLKQYNGVRFGRPDDRAEIAQLRSILDKIERNS
jgi:transglutaminase-like putative cysteine protease